jgi:glycosyltransferase involved in cell wall biosynthesis
VATPKAPYAPLRDPSHEKDLPPGLKVHHLPIINLGGKAPENATGQNKAGTGSAKKLLKEMALSVLFPDHQVIWLATALPGLLRAARREKAQVVMVTAPPFSSFILGALAAKILKLPLVLDFRDEWSGFFTKGFKGHGGGIFWRQMVRSLEHSLVEKAGLVIGNTPGMTKRLANTHRGMKGKYVWIPNGYDAEDVTFLDRENLAHPVEAGKLNLLYTGTVFESHPLDDLFKGFSFLEEKDRQKISLQVVGRVVPGQTTDPGLPGFKVEYLPYVPHDQVLRRMAAADALVMTMADLPGLERMIPAKLFEYLAVKRPVLAISPLGAATAIVEATKAGAVSLPKDAKGLARILTNWLATPPTGLLKTPSFFERRRLTGVLARHLDQLIQGNS